MLEQMRNNKKFKYIAILLLFGSACAALKCIFVSLQMDEEYAISMPYRMLLGDRMFTQIWDPHQTSAFVIQFLIWLYKCLFHTTDGVVIWIRLFGTVIHGIIAYRVYRALCSYLSAEYSFYLGILYFNLLPKGYIMPEFSNMLVWSLTLLLLSLLRLEKRKNLFAAVESGVWMCIMVLAYPSAVILFPFFAWYLWKQETYGRKAACIFAAVCLAGGIAYLAYLFSYMSPSVLLENLQYLMLGNSGHTDAGIAGKLKIYLKGVVYAIGITAAYAFAASLLLLLLKKNKRTKDRYRELSKDEKQITGMYILLFVGIFYQVIHWILGIPRYEMSYVYTVYFVLFGLAGCFAGKLERDARRIVKLWIGSSILMFLAVLMLTDLTIFTSVRYVLPGVVMGIAALLLYSVKVNLNLFTKMARILLLFWCFTAIFIKGWEYRDSEGEMKNITRVGGIVSVGPAKGTFTEYMQSYMQESLYEEMHAYVEPGDKVLILDMGTIGYLFRDVEVASYTTICDPRYNEALLKYWELNPEKYPTVMLVPCWFGELKWNPDSWIMQWIEKEYGAEQVIDGEYFRYYIKRGK